MLWNQLLHNGLNAPAHKQTIFSKYVKKISGFKVPMAWMYSVQIFWFSQSGMTCRFLLQRFEAERWRLLCMSSDSLDFQVLASQLEFTEVIAHSGNWWIFIVVQFVLFVKWISWSLKKKKSFQVLCNPPSNISPLPPFYDPPSGCLRWLPQITRQLFVAMTRKTIAICKVIFFF